MSYDTNKAYAAMRVKAAFGYNLDHEMALVDAIERAPGLHKTLLAIDPKRQRLAAFIAQSERNAATLAKVPAIIDQMIAATVARDTVIERLLAALIDIREHPGEAKRTADAALGVLIDFGTPA